MATKTKIVPAEPGTKMWVPVIKNGELASTHELPVIAWAIHGADKADEDDFMVEPFYAEPVTPLEQREYRHFAIITPDQCISGHDGVYMSIGEYLYKEVGITM